MFKYYIYSISIDSFLNEEGNFSGGNPMSMSADESNSKISDFDNKGFDYELKICTENEMLAITKKHYLEEMVYNLSGMMHNIGILNDRTQKVIQKVFVDYVGELLDFYNPQISDYSYDDYCVFARRFKREVKQIKKDLNRIY